MSVTPPVTLDELKAHLNYQAGDTSNDAELTRHLNAATEAIEQRVGPLVTREFVSRIRVRPALARHHRHAEHRTFLLALDEAPVVDVTSITTVVAGVPTPIAGLVIDELDIDQEAAIIDLGYLRGSSRVYEVTFTAGRGAIADVPDRFKLAVVIVAEHLWETQRGAGAPPNMFGVVAENTASSAHAADYIYRGFALPRRALELIANDETVALA